MKITLEKEYKKFITLEEVPLVRRFIADMKQRAYFRAGGMRVYLDQVMRV